MQNYMKTILSALQNWINKRLRETVPETDKPHMQFVKDKNGETSWEERTHYKEVTTGEVYFLQNATPMLSEDMDGAMMHMFAEPLVTELEAGNMYTVEYNGVEYECPGVLVSDEEGSAIVLGNAAMSGLVGGGNPDAPFMAMCLSPEMSAVVGGATVVVVSLDDAETLVLSIKGFATITTYKKLEEDYLPDSVRNGGKQITITIDEYGNITSDTDFETAWAMTSAQLQASIAIQKSMSYMSMDMSQSPVLVSKFDRGDVWGYRWIQIQHQAYIYDTSDVVGSSQILISWYEDGSINENQYFIPGFQSSQFFSGDQCFPVINGSCFTGYTADRFKTRLGIVDPIFVVTVSNVVNNKGTADKTFAQIKAAYKAGQMVVCKYLNNYHHLITADETMFAFVMNISDGTMVWTRGFTFTENEVTQNTSVVQFDNMIASAIAAALPTPTAEDAGKILRVNSEGKYELVEQ